MQRAIVESFYWIEINLKMIFSNKLRTFVTYGDFHLIYLVSLVIQFLIIENNFYWTMTQW